MHRSRLSVLTIFAAAAACTTRDDSDPTEALARDSTLVATLEVRQKTTLPQQPLPEACATVPVAAQSVVANKPLADFLARRGYDAELMGNTKQARSLFRRAAELDGADKSIAYHLGRTNEALGDRTGAVTAYCRYLTLAPTTAESAEARERVAALSQSDTRVAGVSIGNVAPAPRVSMPMPRRVAPTQLTAEPRVAVSIPVEQPVNGVSPERGAQSSSAVASTVDSSPMRGDGAAPSPEVDGKIGRTADGGEIAAPTPEPSVEQPSTVARSQSRGPSRAQAAGIGAIAGAIIGAATGHSMKSAVIGAASGGVLGTVVGGGGVRPSSRSIRPWSSAQQGARARPVRFPYRVAPAA